MALRCPQCVAPFQGEKCTSGKECWITVSEWSKFKVGDLYGVRVKICFRRQKNCFERRIYQIQPSEGILIISVPEHLSGSSKLRQKHYSFMYNFFCLFTNMRFNSKQGRSQSDGFIDPSLILVATNLSESPPLPPPPQNHKKIQSQLSPH